METIRERWRKDAEVYNELDRDLCMLCKAHGADKRSWYSACFYDIQEVLPEALSLRGVESLSEKIRDSFYLRICKACRAEYLELLATWRKSRIARRGLIKDHDGRALYESVDPEHNIPIRVHGVTKMVTLDEYNYLTKEND